MIHDHLTEKKGSNISEMVASVVKQYGKYIYHLDNRDISDNIDSSDNRREKHECKNLQQFLSTIGIINHLVGRGSVRYHPSFYIFDQVSLYVQFYLGRTHFGGNNPDDLEG